MPDLVHIGPARLIGPDIDCPEIQKSVPKRDFHGVQNSNNRIVLGSLHKSECRISLK